MRRAGSFALASIVSVAAFQYSTSRSLPTFAVGEGDAAARRHMPPDNGQPAPIVRFLSDGVIPNLCIEYCAEHLSCPGIAVREPQSEQPRLVHKAAGHAFDVRPPGPDFGVALPRPDRAARIAGMPSPATTEALARKAAHLAGYALGVAP